MTSSRRLGRRMAAVIAALMGIYAVPAGAVAITPAQDLAFLNAHRAAAGLPAGVTEMPEWTDGCGPGGPAFSADGTNRILDAPLHHAQLLDPFLLRSGTWSGCVAFRQDRSRDFAVPTAFTAPADGGNVGLSQQAREVPFVPGAFVGLADAIDPSTGLVTGPPLHFFNVDPDGARASRGRITAATLTGPSGGVPVRWVDNATTGPLGDLGSLLPAGGIVIPVSPLVPGHYTAGVEFVSTEGRLVHHTWSFRAGLFAAGTGTKVKAEITVACGCADDAASPRDRVKALELRRTWVAIKTRATGPTSVRIYQRNRRASKWSLRRKLRVRFDGRHTERVGFPKLPRGRYAVRVSFRDGRSETTAAKVR